MLVHRRLYSVVYISMMCFMCCLQLGHVKMFYYLINFHKAQDADKVHKSSVKLKSQICGTDMVTDAEASLENQGQSHGIVDSKLLENSQFLGTVVALNFLLGNGATLMIECISIFRVFFGNY